MSAYAPNPTSSSETGYASLSAGLLARKGEAIPSVDAEAHAGVDIEMRPMGPATSSPGDVGQHRNFNAPSTPATDNKVIQRPAVLLPPANGHAPAPADTHANRTVETAPPKNWTLKKLRDVGQRRRSALRSTENNAQQRKATVTFRMAAKEFVRMRFAARDLEMSCQALILEAVECYLEANDVDLVTDDICDAEVNRLMCKKHKTPSP